MRGLVSCGEYALCIVAMCAITSDVALAACDHRPGTPDQTRIRALSPSELQFIWRHTTGRRSIESIMWFDIAIRGPRGENLGKDISGGAHHTGIRYHDEGTFIFQGLQPNTRYCVSIRARTGAGTQGCVSQILSAQSCASTLSAGAAPVAPYVPRKASSPGGTGGPAVAPPPARYCTNSCDNCRRDGLRCRQRSLVDVACPTTQSFFLAPLACYP